MAIIRTALQTIIGITLLLGALLWLYSPLGPIAETVPLVGGQGPNPIRVMQATWSNDASICLSLSRGDADEGHILVCHLRTGKRRSHVVGTGENQVWKATLAPDGRAAFVFGDSGNVQRIGLDAGERTWLFHVPSSSALTELVASPDGAVLAMGVEREIIVCDTSTGDIIESLSPVDSDVNSIAFSADGRLLAVGTDSGSVQIWKRGTSSLFRRFENHHGPVSAIGFHPEMKWIATTGLTDDTLQFYDLETGETVARIETGHSGTRVLAISPDRRLIATGGNDRAIILWDQQTFSQVFRLDGHSGMISALQFSADGKELLSAGDSTIRTWNVEPPASGEQVESVLPFDAKAR